MSKGLSLLLLGAIAVIGFVLGKPTPKPAEEALSAQMAALRQIGLKLRQHRDESPAAEGETMKTRSIADFVALKVLAPEDATYLQDHRVKFYGYDPSRIGGDVPLLESLYVSGSYQARIVCYSDISIVTLPLSKN